MRTIKTEAHSATGCTKRETLQQEYRRKIAAKDERRKTQCKVNGGKDQNWGARRLWMNRVKKYHENSCSTYARNTGPGARVVEDRVT